MAGFSEHGFGASSSTARFLLVSATVLLIVARIWGFVGALGAFVGIQVMLLLCQPLVAGLVGGLRFGPREGKVVFVETDAPYVTGGVAGLPGAETIFVPARWKETLTPEQLSAALARRKELVRSGSRARGVLLALGWNTAGFALSGMLSGRLETVAGLTGTFLGATLWSFVGVLVLPTPSQKGVFEGDARLRESGVPRQVFESLIVSLDRDQDDEPSRVPGVERIFHPDPVGRSATVALGRWRLGGKRSLARGAGCALSVVGGRRVSLPRRPLQRRPPRRLGFSSVRLRELPRGACVTSLMRKDEVRYRTVTTKNYTIQIPESWELSEETPFGQREMSPKVGKGQLTSMTGPGLGKQSWDQLYQTSLYFILRGQPAGSMTATRPAMGKSKQGFETASWSMLDRKKTVVARYVVLKSKADNILALSVKIPEGADRTQLEAIFERLVATAVVK